MYFQIKQVIKISYKQDTNERIAVCIPVYVEMGAFYEYVLIKQLKESNSKSCLMFK